MRFGDRESNPARLPQACFHYTITPKDRYIQGAKPSRHETLVTCLDGFAPRSRHSASPRLAGIEKVEMSLPTRILFDTNIWSAFARDGVGSDLFRAVKTAGVTLVVPPLVLYEALATPSAESRQRLVNLLTMRTWKRLMPEAYTQCLEIISEIKRLRPEWLRSQPDMQRFTKQRYDWTRKTGGLWKRARVHTEATRNFLGISDGWSRSLLEQARWGSQEQRHLVHSQGVRTIGPLRSFTATFSGRPPEGIGNEPVHAWRVSAWNCTKIALAISRHPYRDWLEPFLDFERIECSETSWNRFWLLEVAADEMPCLWVQWAFELLQSVQKVTPGTPGDAALSNYLPECDLIISADANFIRNVVRIRDDAPYYILDAAHVPAGSGMVAETLALISDRKHQKRRVSP